MTKKLELTTVNTIPEMQKLMKPMPLAVRYNMRYDKEVKSVTYVVDPKKYKTLELLHMTDTQQGHKGCNMEKLTEFRDWILKKPNRFMLFGGDMGDFGTKLSVGSPFEQIYAPDQAIYKIIEFWAPARHRILGYVGGNHERRTAISFGDAGLAIAAGLQIPYSSGKQYIHFKYGEHNPFTVHLWHGKGAGVTAGAKMGMLDRTMRDEADAHLNLVGHLHDPMCKFMSRKKLQPDGTFKLVKTGVAMSSSFLEYWHGYAEVMNLPVNPLMMALATLEPNGHWELTLR